MDTRTQATVHIVPESASLGDIAVGGPFSSENMAAVQRVRQYRPDCSEMLSVTRDTR